MPLIVLSGYPSSGKTTLSETLKDYFQQEHSKNSVIISENVIIGERKNVVFQDAREEKLLRDQLKSEVERQLASGVLVILDSGNYIKGYRYELYCLSKSLRSTQCTVLCDINPKLAQEWNLTRNSSQQYDNSVFDALIQRFEEPDGKDRWDSPLFNVIMNEKIETSLLLAMYKVLYEKDLPKPNQSTELIIPTEGDFVFQLNSITNEIIKKLVDDQKAGLPLSVSIKKGESGSIILPVTKIVTFSKLASLRKQFISYTMSQCPGDASNIPTLFASYLKSQLM